MVSLNKIIRKVQAENVCLNSQDLGKDVELLLFSDASYGNLRNDGSQGGHGVCLKGRDGMINPVTWQSKKIRRITRSTMASEALALVDGIDCVTSIGMLLNELLYNKGKTVIPIKCYVDNNDLFQAINSNKDVSERRLRREVNIIKELIKNKDIDNVYWIPTKNQIADVLTKRGASTHNILNLLNQ